MLPRELSWQPLLDRTGPITCKSNYYSVIGSQVVLLPPPRAMQSQLAVLKFAFDPFWQLKLDYGVLSTKEV